MIRPAIALTAIYESEDGSPHGIEVVDFSRQSLRVSFDLGLRSVTRMKLSTREGQQLTNIFNWKAQTARRFHKRKRIEVVNRVASITIVVPLGRREITLALVVSDRTDGNAGLHGNGTNVHCPVTHFLSRFVSRA